VKKKLSFTIGEFITLFKKDGLYFRNEIVSFSKRKDSLDGAKISIGVIGITSSGKSTFLNAILGEKLLPAKVRPSTGVQVVCEYGKEEKAVIVFKKGKRVADKEFFKNICAELEKYGDEKGNPENKEAVEEIRLFSPKFCLDRNIILVDTPGLDSYGLPNHEIITMQLVVPTVQMIIFITTVKGTSDQKNLEFLDLVTAENKPVLIIQNMIDSVSPKESVRGIEKTCDEILGEHRERLQKVIKRANKLPVRNAPIVQLSAKEALRDKDTSGFNNFIAVLNNQVKETNPGRVGLFYAQIKRSLIDVEKELTSMLHGKEVLEKQCRLEKDGIEIIKQALYKKDECFDSDIEIIRNQIILFGEKKELIKNKIEERYRFIEKPSTFDAGFKREIDDFLHNGAQEIYDSLKNLITEVVKEQVEFCKTLNLREDEIVCRHQFSQSQIRIEIPIESSVRTEIRKEKEKGFWGGVKRMNPFGDEDSGWTIKKNLVTEKWINVDKYIEYFLREVRKKSIDSFNDLLGIKKSWDFAFRIYDNEISKSIEALKDKVKTEIDSDLCHEILKKIKGYYELERSFSFFNERPHDSPLTVPREELKQLECKKLGVSIWGLAHQASYLQLKGYRKEVLQRCGNKKPTVIWGWGALQIQGFTDIFFPEYRFGENDFNRKLLVKDDLIIVNEGAAENEDKFEIPGDPVYFVLLNVIQIGNTEKNYHKSKVKKKSGKFIWVMDSLKEHSDQLAGDNLIEAYREVSRFVKSSGKEQDTISLMVSCRDLYYSVLLDELFFTMQWDQTRKQNFISEMHKIFKHHCRHKTGDYIKAFEECC
jgi:GTPase Era involved in 16S rRNA processing